MDLRPLIQELGIDKLPKEDQETIVEVALSTIEKRMSIRLARALTSEQMDEFEKAVKKGDQEALDRIYPNLKQEYQQEVETLKQDILAITPGPQGHDGHQPHQS